MPEQQSIMNLKGIQIYDQKISKRLTLLGRVHVGQKTLCRHCGQSNFRLKEYRKRYLKHSYYDHKVVALSLEVPRLFCKACCRSFMAPIPGVLPRKRSSESYRKEVYHLHQGGLTQVDLKKRYEIGTATVERWYKDFVQYRVNELKGRSCPKILGIDEHFFSRKQGYATTFADLRNNKVFDVVLGRYERDLKGYLNNLPGREKVQVVVIDMADNYRRMIKKYFPNALIVTDRFHVIRWANQKFLEAWKQIDPEGRDRYRLVQVMRKHRWRLKSKQQSRLDKYLNEQPAVKALYDFKQDLVKLLLKKDVPRDQLKSLISQYIWHMNELLQSPIEAMKKLGKTLQGWQNEIVRMWRFSKTNGITEGLHTKMEMISRRAYGFRNFNNYRLRVIALCGWDGYFVNRH